MRPWLLLVSLLVSDPCPLGDIDWVMENYSWSLRRKLLGNGQMTPLGLEMLQTQTEHQRMCMQRSCVYVAVQRNQRTSPFPWAYRGHDDRGCSVSHQEFTGIIHRINIPELVVSLFHGEGKSVPAFLRKSDTLPALRVVRESTPIEAGGEASHIAMDIINDQADSGSAWSLHHHAAASGHHLQAFLLAKSKSWASATTEELQKMLTKRYCAVATVIISCCFKVGETRSAANIKKQSKEEITQPQMRQKESTQRAMDIQVLTQYGRQWPSKAAVSQQDVLQAATLHSGSSSVNTSDTSQLEIHGNAVRIMKKHEHLTSHEESLLQKSVQTQHSLKAASSVHDDDGFYVKRQLFLVCQKKSGSINRPRVKIKASQEDDKEDFSGKIITKQAEGERETEQSRANTIGNGNQEGLAYILPADSTHKTDNNDVDHKQVLPEVGEEALFMLFILLPDTERETQTEPSSERKLILNTDTGCKTVNIPIKQLDDPPPVNKVLKENFITEPVSSKCKCLKEMYAPDRTERRDIKPAERTAEVTTVSAPTEEQVKGTTEKIEPTETENAPHENRSINQTKQGENAPPEEPVMPSLPPLERMETQAEHKAETTTVNMETTSIMDVFNQGITEEAGGRPSTEETPAATMSPESELITNNTQATSAARGKPFAGLRMRENIPADTVKLREGTENEAAANRPESARKEDQNDPKVNPFTFAKPFQTAHQRATDTPPKATDDNMPLCRGLIHRTEAGWKHCADRSGGTGSKVLSSREPADAFRDPGEREKAQPSTRDHTDGLHRGDEHGHFYYFDGVVRRAQRNVYPYYKRQGRRKRSQNSAVTRSKKGSLLRRIRRLTSRNKASRFKRSGAEEGVQRTTR